MSDDPTPVSVSLVKALLAEIHGGERDWRDEQRAQFAALRNELGVVNAAVGVVRERLTAIETTAHGAEQSRTEQAEAHDNLAARVLACEGKHGDHASRVTVDKLARNGAQTQRRMPRWIEHLITVVVTTACTAALGSLMHRGWVSPSDVAAIQSNATPGAAHGQ